MLPPPGPISSPYSAHLAPPVRSFFSENFVFKCGNTAQFYADKGDILGAREELQYVQYIIIQK